jgi:hypothetical protein
MAFSCLAAEGTLDVTRVGLQAPQDVAALSSAGELYMRQLRIFKALRAGHAGRSVAVAQQDIPATAHVGS